jgi:hypothetical protein
VADLDLRGGAAHGEDDDVVVLRRREGLELGVDALDEAARRERAAVLAEEGAQARLAEELAVAARLGEAVGVGEEDVAAGERGLALDLARLLLDAER